jgi:excisionase family DNA binding protein
MLTPTRPSERTERLSYCASEAAKLLGINACSIKTLLDQGRLRGSRINRKILISLDSINRFLAGAKESE